MAAQVTMDRSPLWRGVRWLVWGGAAALLLLPLVAMQFTSEVNWTLFDFVAMGGLLAAVCGAYELAVRVARSNTYVVAFGLAVATAFFTTWVNLAVGIIGDEDNPANGLFFLVILVGFIGAVLALLRARGMALAMEAAAAAQVAVAAVAWVTTPQHPEGYVLSLVLAAMWFTAGRLFRVAARETDADA